MKFYRFKQVQRFVFFGYDDLFIDDPGSLSRTSKQSRPGIYDTKRLRFNFIAKNGIQLSNNAKLVVESLFLPAEIYTPETTVEEERKGAITVRLNKLQGETFDSQNDNLNSPLLFASQESGKFINTYPEMLYNFSISQSFFSNGYIEFEITYPNVIIPEEGLRDFFISLIIYDVNEEELVLKDTPEVEDIKPHSQTNLGMLGFIPLDHSRYAVKKKK